MRANFYNAKNNALIIKNIYDCCLLYYQRIIFEWQFFATLIQAVTVMEMSFIESRFSRTHTILIC